MFVFSTTEVDRRNHPHLAACPCVPAPGLQTLPYVSLPPPTLLAPVVPMSPDPALWWTLPTPVCVCGVHACVLA